VPPALGCAAVLWFAWPGSISVDTAAIVLEAERSAFSGHQEPMYGFLWSLVLGLLPAQVALVGCFILQVALFWWSFARLARGAMQEGSRVAAVLASLAGFLPPLMCFCFHVDSNIITGVAWLGALGLCARPGERPPLARAGFLLWVGFIARSGMILGVVPVAFACLKLAKPAMNAWRALGCAVAFGIGIQGLSYVTGRVLLGNPPRDSVLAVSQYFDMAGIYERTGVHHVPREFVTKGHEPEEVLANYEPGSCVSLLWRVDDKPVFRLPANRDEAKVIRDAWMQTIREQPGAWLDVKLRFAGLFLMVGVDWALDCAPLFDRNRDFGLSRPEDPYAAPLGMYAANTARWLVWKGWLWLIVTGSLVVVALVLRSARFVEAAAVFLGCICVLMPHLLLGQAALARYEFLPFLLSLVAALLVLPGLLARLRRSGSREMRLAS